MKNLKRLAAILLALCMVLGCAACSNKSSGGDTPTQAPSNNSTDTKTTDAPKQDTTTTNNGGSTDNNTPTDTDVTPEPEAKPDTKAYIDDEGIWRYTDTDEIVNLGGMLIELGQHFGGDEVEPSTASEIARAEYLDYIQETYNFTFKEVKLGSFGIMQDIINDFCTTGGDENYVFCLDNAWITAPMNKGLFYDLATLDCSGNYLTTLDVSKNTALTELYCFNNHIRDADMQTLISSLHQNGGTLCAYATENDDNEMTTTNVADAKAKKWQVKAWDGSKYVDYAGIFAVYINATNFPDAAFRNYVGDFDLNKNGYLTDDEIAYVTQIIVSLMNITSLKGIEHFTALTYLECNGNQLTALDVSTNKALENLICTDNQLSVLDVKANKALVVLDCSKNKLTTLDVSENKNLTILYCEHNQLTALDVTKNTELSTLYCYGNKITKGMQTLISSLRQNGGELVGYSSENDGNKITTKQVAAAGEKGWTVYMMVGSELVPYDGILLGDANGDNKVDVADIVAIVSHQKGKDVNGFSLPAADVNNDDKADEKDIDLILPMIMGE